MSSGQPKIKAFARFAAASLAAVALALPTVASGAETASMTAHFSPNRLLAHTTVSVSFKIGVTGGPLVPSPLTDVSLLLPAGMGLETTTLGLETCSSRTLIARGASGCSPDAVMGFGRAVAEAQFGQTVVQESATITSVMAPSKPGEHTSMLFFVEGRWPMFAELVFPGSVLGASGPFGQRIDTQVPLTQVVALGPFASVVSLKSSIGPEHLTYYRQQGHKRIAFKPIGMQIPPTCPAGGFPFAATLSFLDGTSIITRTSVPCPHSVAHGHRHRK